MHPNVPPGSFALNFDMMTGKIDSERRNFRTNRDNAIVVPEPTAQQLATLDASWIYRMVEVTWPQRRTHINNIIYPRESTEDLQRRMQNQTDAYPSLFRYLNWNDGNNHNLKQMVDEALPSYHEWINTHVMPPPSMFRGPASKNSVSRSNLTDTQTSTLLELVSTISLNRFDNASLPSTKFVGDNSARDELAINLKPVSTVIRQWTKMARNTLSTGTYVYIWPG